MPIARDGRRRAPLDRSMSVRATTTTTTGTTTITTAAAGCYGSEREQHPPRYVEPVARMCRPGGAPCETHSAGFRNKCAGDGDVQQLDYPLQLIQSFIKRGSHCLLASRNR